MNDLQRAAAIVREALSSARAQPVASLVTALIVAGMCAAIILTTGRSVGAEQQVLDTLDSAGTRSIVVEADPSAGLSSDVVQRLQRLRGIQWAGAFGPATDIHNTAIPSGKSVALRKVWSANLQDLGMASANDSMGRTAWTSSSALAVLGLPDAAGGITETDGTDYSVQGQIRTPDFLQQLAPLVLSPQSDSTTGQIAILIVVTEQPSTVKSMARAIGSLLAVRDPTKVRVTTSENLAALRSAVQGKLGSYGRGLVAVIFAVTAGLVAIVQYAFVMLRRKDFGRRRALGASRGIVMSLVLCQVGTLAAIGSTLGSAIALASLVTTGDPLPSAGFVIAVDLLAVAVSTAAALIPALVAAHREPIRELRVP